MRTWGWRVPAGTKVFSSTPRATTSSMPWPMGECYCSTSYVYMYVLQMALCTSCVYCMLISSDTIYSLATCRPFTTYMYQVHMMYYTCTCVLASYVLEPVMAHFGWPKQCHKWHMFSLTCHYWYSALCIETQVPTMPLVAQKALQRDQCANNAKSGSFHCGSFYFWLSPYLRDLEN